MAHFAKVKNGIVTKVIVAEQDYIDNLIDHEPGKWVQTSYNTYRGEHKLGGTPLRKNFAGIGFIYDEQRDAFYQPQPFPSWTLDEETCHWEPPTPMPTDGKIYQWNEENKTWDEIE
tara:strand:+ start:1667 stop:2014 length:348 start_codon:yes stop_codon:yes gene_type:complete